MISLAFFFVIGAENLKKRMEEECRKFEREKDIVCVGESEKDGGVWRMVWSVVVTKGVLGV